MNDIDYSLYLVTGRELLPPGKDYFESLEESLQGGVTVVQIREKNTDTGEVRLVIPLVRSTLLLDTLVHQNRKSFKGHMRHLQRSSAHQRSR